MTTRDKTKSRSLKIEETELLDVEGAARFLNLQPITVYRKARLGIIPGNKKAGRWIFSKRKLLEWVEAG